MKFQSLVRDSAHSDSASCAGCVAIISVSIPRSGFCPFRLGEYLNVRVPSRYVSIPRSGFCPFRPSACARLVLHITEFQSLVRDSAHSDPVSTGGLNSQQQFQSLVRDSAHSDCGHVVGDEKAGEFQSLVRDSAHSDFACYRPNRRQFDVSIPRSGFCPFRRMIRWGIIQRNTCFNPSFGILPIQTAHVCRTLCA